MVYTSLTSPDNQDYPYDIKIAHLYGDLMNTYGDNGNVLMLKYVAEKLGFKLILSLWKMVLTRTATTSSSLVVAKTMNKQS